MGKDVNPTAVHIRLAESKDVAMTCLLIKRLAKYEKMVDQCFVSEETLMPHLFDHPPLQGPSVFLIEITESSAPNPSSDSMFSAFSLIHSQVSVYDQDYPLFKSSVASDSIVVGFALTFPKFSAVLCKPCIFIENLFIRDPYINYELKKKMLGHIAKIAIKNKIHRVEWCILNGDNHETQFYEKSILPDRLVCSLSGSNLQNLAS